MCPIHARDILRAKYSFMTPADFFGYRLQSS